MMWNLLFLISCLVISSVTCNSLVTSVDHLVLDEKNHLKDHTLLYSKGCGTVEDLPLRKSFMASKSLLEDILGVETSDEQCSAVCLEKGTRSDLLMTPMTSYRLPHVDDLKSAVMRSCQSVEFGLINYTDEDLDLYWIHPNTKKHSVVRRIGKGEGHTSWINTLLGHVFVVRVAGGTDRDPILGRWTVRHNMITSIGEQKSALRDRDVTNEVKATFDTEWKRANSVTRTFTQLGFGKGKLPRDIFASMNAYYYNNQADASIEEWGGKGVFVNWWETDVYFVAMPPTLRTHWQMTLKELVEKWVGIPLEQTSIYGLRRYENNAKLLTHVDRTETHAASLIVNVFQDMGSAKEPWMVEIYDFEGNLHEVPMEEGDIVYYESARCLHGRMQPFEGKYYVNVFTHYRPVGNRLWYQETNPEGSVQPIDTLGNCVLDSNGKPSCDGKYGTPPFLSPKLQKLHSGDDLFKFWQEINFGSDLNAKHSEL